MATKTAQQRRLQARNEYESFLATCPSRQLMQTLGGKWTALVIAALADGPTRYNQVARTVAGISPKMLTQTLRTLERDGLVSRSIVPTVPVQVEYVLTGLGRELLEIVLDFKTWVEAHTDSINAARARFDSSNRDQSSALES
jgi:DNA-binding HxlR family transcriptional regulator